MSSHVPPPNDVSSTSSVHTLLNEYNRFILREEDEGGIDLSGVATPTVDVDDSKSLVNRFLTDRTINFAALKDTLIPIWRPVKGIYVKELRLNLYIFQFFRDHEINRVLNDGPWSFNNNILLLKRLQAGEQATQVSLSRLDLWVQAYDLPTGFMSDTGPFDW